MITVYLNHVHLSRGYTLGKLATPTQTFHTLEDTVREIEGVPVGAWKIAGQTAIPRGTYPLVLDVSNRFKRVMPHILDVPGFVGIRIHAGNSAEDTEGCILLGWGVTSEGRLTDSRNAVDDLIVELHYFQTQNLPVQIQIS